MTNSSTPALDNLEIPEGFTLAPFDYGYIASAQPLYWKDNGTDVVLGFHVLEKHVNPGQIAHGGFLMTMIDMAFGMNIGRRAGDVGFLPTTSLSYDFIQAAHLGQWIESKVDFIHMTHKRAVVSGYLMGPDGVVVRANGTNKIMRKDDTRLSIPDHLRHDMKNMKDANHD